MVAKEGGRCSRLGLRVSRADGCLSTTDLSTSTSVHPNSPCLTGSTPAVPAASSDPTTDDAPPLFSVLTAPLPLVSLEGGPSVVRVSPPVSGATSVIASSEGLAFVEKEEGRGVAIGVGGRRQEVALGRTSPRP